MLALIRLNAICFVRLHTSLNPPKYSFWLNTLIIIFIYICIHIYICLSYYFYQDNIYLLFSCNDSIYLHMFLYNAPAALITSSQTFHGFSFHVKTLLLVFDAIWIFSFQIVLTMKKKQDWVNPYQLTAMLRQLGVRHVALYTVVSW